MQKKKPKTKNALHLFEGNLILYLRNSRGHIWNHNFKLADSKINDKEWYFRAKIAILFIVAS